MFWTKFSKFSFVWILGIQIKCDEKNLKYFWNVEKS